MSAIPQFANALNVVTSDDEVLPSGSPGIYNFFVNGDILKGKDYLGVVHIFGSVSPPFVPFRIGAEQNISIPGSFSSATGTLVLPVGNFVDYFAGIFVRTQNVNITGPASLTIEGIFTYGSNIRDSENVTVLALENITGNLPLQAYWCPLGTFIKGVIPLGSAARGNTVRMAYTLTASEAVNACDLVIAPYFIKGAAFET